MNNEEKEFEIGEMVNYYWKEDSELAIILSAPDKNKIYLIYIIERGRFITAGSLFLDKQADPIK